MPAPWFWVAHFDSPAEVSEWRAEVPADGAVRHVVDGEVRMLGIAVEDADSSAKLMRRIDASRLRGQRLRMTARTRTRDALARTGLYVRRVGAESGIGDIAESRAIASPNWTVLHVVIDVAGDASDIELKLWSQGKGDVWFDEVRVEQLGAVDRETIGGRELSGTEIERLAILGQILAMVRYFHPSDESAATDWDFFAAAAVERVLAGRDQSISEVLDEVLAPIAPLTHAYREGAPPSAESTSSPRGRTTWWHHIGLGPSPVVYLSFRDGIDEPEPAGLVYVSVPAHIVAGCSRATVALAADRLDAGMSAWLVMGFRNGKERDDWRKEKLRPPGSVTTTTDKVPRDVAKIHVGLRASGHGTVEASRLTFACDDRRPVVLDLRSALRESEGIYAPGKSLYEHGVLACATGPCLHVRRKTTMPGRWLDTSIGRGLRLRMPLVLAVAEGRTQPAASRAPALAPATAVTDRSTRLAAVLMTWATLKHFYPYWGETRSDWSRELGPALEGASRARSPDETYSVLARLVARLADAHARVDHPGIKRTGLGPLTFRRFDDTLIVAGGLQPYLADAPVGAEVLAVDGVPSKAAYERTAEQLSSPTEGFRERFMGSFLLNLGPAGTLRRLDVRGTDGGARELIVPFLPREEVRHQVREPRPRSGTELAPGTFYVDLDTLDEETWQSLMPRLAEARAIVFDMRGYPSKAAFYEVIPHLTKEEVSSPIFDVPLVGPTGVAGYERSWWRMWPKAPRLRGRSIFLIDGRAASAAETFMQMIRDHGLGILVGEPTGGTNGNQTWFRIPGGFEVRFTGMRVTSLRGEVIHGRGIQPDLLVRPTLSGVRAGRDEVLEAGIRIATGSGVEAQKEAHRE